MPIQIAPDHLQRAWNSSLQQDVGRLVSLVLQVERDSGLDGRPLLAEAIESVNVEALKRHVGDDGVPQFAFGAAAPTPRGYGFGVYVLDESDLQLGVDLLARALESTPLTGTVRHLSQADIVGPQVDVRIGPTAVLGVRAAERSHRRVLPLWGTEDAGVRDLAVLADQFLGGGEGQIVAHGHDFSTVTSLGGCTEFLETVLTDRRAGISFSASRAGRGWRCLSFNDAGHVVLDIREPDRSIPEQFAELTELATRWHSWCDFAFVAVAATTRTRMLYLLQDMRPWISYPRYYMNYRYADREFVPDVFGWQVVTGRHLAKARDLSDWHVEEIGEDRHVLVAKDLDRWTSEVAIEPDALRELVRRGRDCFGEMILQDGARP